MSRETISFHRQFPVQLSLKQGIAVFLFSAGFTGKMNPQTGMIVSLPEVDLELKRVILKSSKEKFTDEFQFLNEAWELLAQKLEVTETKLQTEAQIFCRQKKSSKVYTKSNFAVTFPQEEKLYWLYSEKPIKQKLTAANLDDLLQQLSKFKDVNSLEDPLSSARFVF